MNTAIESLFTDLSDSQREAVAHTDGPLLILAGPGSGKTRVVTRRAAHLACTVTDPTHILAITFTNKAAREMRERVDTLKVAGGMTVSTFHALGARLLREYNDLAGVPRNFTIVDRDDRRKLLKKAIEDCDLSSTNWAPANVEQDISRAKNALQTAEEFGDECVDWRGETVARIYTSYEKLLVDNASLDFDDLLMRVATMLMRDEGLRSELEDRFRYVLVDEYQDTNAAQYKIARLLTRDRQNLCATGDPDQSIYGWRGADIENILRFERDYPSAKVVRLEQNYRSTQRILSAADKLIAGNTKRKEKTLWTHNEEGPAIRAIECKDGVAEAEVIARDITCQIRDGARPSDCAVFYRMNSLSRTIEEALLRGGIGYQIARGVAFYSRKEIKDVLAYLRVLVNPADEVSLLRIINTPPRGIGATTVQRLVREAGATGRQVLDLIKSGDDLSGVGRSAAKVREFAELLERLGPLIDRPPRDALESVMSHSGLNAYYLEAAEADDTPLSNVRELISAAAQFQADHPEASVLDWLEASALASDVDTVSDEAGVVTLMTLHAAKGLEFPIVYIVGLEEGILPFRRRAEGVVDDEEERRLLFVGMTRAKNRLTLLRARLRMLAGVTERTVRSPFLDELPGEEIEWSQVGADSRSLRKDDDRGDLPDDIAKWASGTLVRHPVEGLGQVTSIHRGAKRTHVDVRFKSGKQQSWVLEFAELQRVDFDDVGD